MRVVLELYRVLDMFTGRIHLALKAYHELLNCVCAMDQSTDAAVRNSAQVIKGLSADSLFTILLCCCLLL